MTIVGFDCPLLAALIPAIADTADTLFATFDSDSSCTASGDQSSSSTTSGSIYNEKKIVLSAVER